MEANDIAILIGKTLTEAINRDDEEIIFTDTDEVRYHLFHDQNCCESVRVDDIVGDLADLVGSPVLVAEEVSSEGVPAKEGGWDSDESYTWTFYRLRTNKGSVTIKWYGTSNGYYSERVDFAQMH